MSITDDQWSKRVLEWRPCTGKCEPVPKADTIGLFSISMGMHGMCENLEKIEGFRECRGSCPSADTYSMLTRKYEPACQCCRVERFTLVPVLLSCEDGSQVKHSVATADQCSCRRCGDAWYPEEPSSPVGVLSIKY
ncbi:hemocytin-like isoform X2 [Maniola jurtina]|uniref:hemocytin-like isoform X2 n=1 Tax=Maniola jurtina TaxID=191418 RepID=UPI001E6877A0|nr:hemocytin-like isoform X2 [Maniola jurtina]